MMLETHSRDGIRIIEMRRAPANVLDAGALPRARGRAPRRGRRGGPGRDRPHRSGSRAWGLTKRSLATPAGVRDPEAEAAHDREVEEAWRSEDTRAHIRAYL